MTFKLRHSKIRGLAFDQFSIKEAASVAVSNMSSFINIIFITKTTMFLVPKFFSFKMCLVHAA